MAAWDTNERLSREAAIARVKEMAKEEGIKGSFKVFYKDELIANPSDLPDEVDMSKVRVSATLDNA